MSQPDRIEDLGTYEMVWDCKFCGTQSLPARTHKFCPNCGSAQDPRSRRFPADDEKRSVENYVNHGADVICAACTTPNAADAKFCQQCGAPLENAQKVGTVASQVRGENEKFDAQAKRNIDQEALDTDLRKAGALPDPNAAKGSNRGMILILGIGALIVVAVLVLIFWRRDASASVVGHEWERSINIEEFAAVPDEAWCDSMPSGAYNITQREEQRSSRSVPAGEECGIRRIDNGDGTFSERRECNTIYEEEPIYDNYCSFTVNRWVYARAISQEGLSLQDAPRWPLLQLNSGSSLGSEREAGREETYVLILQSGDSTYRCDVSFDLWQRAQEQSGWNLEVSVVTGQPNCNSLEPAA